MTHEHPQLSDSELDELIRHLHVPARTAGFEERLRGRLTEARDGQTRVPAPRREVRATRPRLRWLTIPAVSGTAIAASLMLVVGGGQRADVASAGEVVDRLARAISSTHNVTGVLIRTERAHEGDPFDLTAVRRARLSTLRWTFAITSRGDYRLSGADGRRQTRYDAHAGVASEENIDAPGLTVHRGLGPGPPDNGFSRSELQRDVAAVVRALRSSHPERVRDVTRGGRRVWILETAVQRGRYGGDGDRLVVEVDQQTGLPVRIVETWRGIPMREQRMERLAVNQPLSHHMFRAPDRPAERFSHHFERMPMTVAGRKAHYRPLQPSWLPTGYRQAETAYAADQPTATGAEGANPANRDVISTAYRRGLDQITITTRRIGPDRTAWMDPISAGEATAIKAERLSVTQGALAGTISVIAGHPRVVPHLWALTDRLVVTVAGDLDRAELLRVAGSLRTVPARP